MHLPVTFDDVVDEIVRFTDLPRAEVERRVWMQALQPGWNVVRDVAHFGATPFVYDDNMAKLYREGDGFIFESMVYWARPARQLWIQHGADRIRRYVACRGIEQPELRILMLGDGPGNDSLYLAGRGFRVDFFEVAGSRTFDFATKRFAHYGYLNRGIRVIHNYAACLNGEYDVVVSFEVLEHLPQPLQTIADMNAMLKLGGLAIVTDDFGDILGRLPTHLKSTAHFLGKTPFLFAKNGLALTWYSRDELFKPYEFEKRSPGSLSHTGSLLRDCHVRSLYLSNYARRLARFIDKLPYFGG